MRQPKNRTEVTKGLKAKMSAGNELALPARSMPYYNVPPI